MTEAHVVLIEDSERYIQELSQLIMERLDLTQPQVSVVRTEAGFYSHLADWEEKPPAVFIVDVMIPYMDVGDSDEAVPARVREEAKRHRFYRAGIRCIRTLLGSRSLKNIPIIVHSILDETDLRSDDSYPVPAATNVTVCAKEANGHRIIEEIATALGRARV